jgi:hypothetical protein
MRILELTNFKKFVESTHDIIEVSKQKFEAKNG